MHGDVAQVPGPQTPGYSLAQPCLGGGGTHGVDVNAAHLCLALVSAFQTKFVKVSQSQLTVRTLIAYR